MKSSFSKGVNVQYQHWVGKIHFICDEYITICISSETESHSSRNWENNVCVLVYKNEWDLVKLWKESNK